MSYQRRLKLKYLSYNLLGISTIAVILLIAYLNNRLVETSITMTLFFVFKNLFEKQYHCKSLLMCSFVSVIVFTIVSLLELPLCISILFSVIITFIINLVSYYFRDYLDNRTELSNYSAKFKKMKTKRLEELTEAELLRFLPNVKKDTIHIVYGYIHRDKGTTANEYAYKYNISEALMYKYLKQVKDEYRNLVNI